MKSKLFTIGHSNRDLQTFLLLLRENGVTAVADVRSYPYSRRYPHFDQQPLKVALQKATIDYVFMGDELGARRSERQCYVDGKAQYDLIAKTDSFQRGIERIKKGASQHRIALMCSERDPLKCHRTILVCKYLRDELDVFHIITSNQGETQGELERRLFAATGRPQRDLFMNYLELLDQAYALQADRIAYVEGYEEDESQSLARE